MASLASAWVMTRGRRSTAARWTRCCSGISPPYLTWPDLTWPTVSHSKNKCVEKKQTWISCQTYHGRYGKCSMKYSSWQKIMAIDDIKQKLKKSRTSTNDLLDTSQHVWWEQTMKRDEIFSSSERWFNADFNPNGQGAPYSAHRFFQQRDLK